MPTRLGGFGLHEALPTSDAAFIGSCNSTRQLTCQLLANSSLFAGKKTPQSSGYHVESGVLIPGEIQCRERLQSVIPPNSSCHLEKDTQHDIQLVLDAELQ